MVTGAIVTASGKLKQKLKKLASHLLEANEQDLEFRGGAVGTKGVPGMEKTIAELALMGNFFRMSFPDDPDFDSGLETTAVTIIRFRRRRTRSVSTSGSSIPSWDTCVTWRWSRSIRRPGKVEIWEYAAVHDAGTMVNPRTLGGHIRGGTANGIGSVLFEEYKYDSMGSS